jgi:hypothetical protein
LLPVLSFLELSLFFADKRKVLMHGQPPLLKVTTSSRAPCFFLIYTSWSAARSLAARAAEGSHSRDRDTKKDAIRSKKRIRRKITNDFTPRTTLLSDRTSGIASSSSRSEQNKLQEITQSSSMKKKKTTKTTKHFFLLLLLQKKLTEMSFVNRIVYSEKA